ncbi:MAG: SLBB domain-containing protein [Cryomorphaceae bacterium]|nr:SLBB domain-containing protein [Cryomorphaceae bacterium]
MKRILFLVVLLVTTVLSAQNLSGIKVDDLSDAQIRSILAQGKERGLDINEGENVALSMGLSKTEAAKFRARVEALNGPSKPNTAQGTGAAVNEVAGTVASGETLGNTANVETEVLEQAEIKSEAAVAIAGTEETVAAPGEDLPVNIFGQQLFRGANLKIYERSLDAKAPDHYILGMGDELGVSVYGTAFFNEVYKVDSRGYIAINKVGNVAVRGLTFAEARNVIKGRMAPYFNLSSNTFAFNLAYSRTVTVNIVGEVINPGSYKLPAINTAFNALMAAGGPSDIGTLRDVKVIRGGKVVKTLDVYAFLLNPVADNDYYLQENDYISVGTHHHFVTIAGAVKRPMRYELLPGESLAQAIQFAGGFASNAYTDAIQIQRQAAEEQILMDVASDQMGMAMNALDIVRVKTKNNELKQVVSIYGGVQQPGNFRFEAGITLRSLIEKAGGIRQDSIVAIDKAWMVRMRPDFTRYYTPIDIQGVLADVEHPDNRLLKAKDQITITLKKDYSDEERVSITGAVRNPFVMNYAEGLTVANMLQMADGIRFETFSDRAYLTRTREDLTQEIMELDLASILADPSVASNVSLQPRDVINVLAKPDVDAQMVVSVAGAVRSPKRFTYAEGMTLGDALRLVGGLLPNADYTRVEVSRISAFDNIAKGTNREIRTMALMTAVPQELSRNLNADAEELNFPLQPYDQVVVREIPDYELQELVLIQGEVRYPGYYPLLGKDEAMLSLIQRAGGLTRFADAKNASLTRKGAPNIVMNLKRAMINRRSRYNYELLPGDALLVPLSENLISVIGGGHKFFDNTQESTLNAPYVPQKRARYYVKHFALGFNTEAARSNTYVKYPNGEVGRTRNFGLFKVYPKIHKGATIYTVVKVKEERERRQKRETKPLDMNQAVATVTAALTGFATLYVLMTR